MYQQNNISWALVGFGSDDATDDRSVPSKSWVMYSQLKEVVSYKLSPLSSTHHGKGHSLPSHLTG